MRFLPFSPCGRRCPRYEVSWADEGSASAEGNPSPSLREATLSHKGRGEEPECEPKVPRSFDTPLPIDAVLDDLARTLAGHNAAVLVAPPGAGKTTRVPLALLDAPWVNDRQ